MTDKLPTLSLDQFRASRRYCADLAEALSTDFDGPSPGFLYGPYAYFIELNTREESAEQGAFLLTLGRESWLSHDLADMEVRLYRYALGEAFEAPTLTTEELTERAINAACWSVQEVLGIEAGDVAGIYWSDDDYRAVIRRYVETERAHLPVTAAQIAVLKERIADARPTSDDDWGSERQVAAQNLAFETAERMGVDVSSFETTKETTDEMLTRLATLADALNVEG